VRATVTVFTEQLADGLAGVPAEEVVEADDDNWRRIVVISSNWLLTTLREDICSNGPHLVISSNYLLYWDAGKAIRKVFSESNITVAFTSEFNRFPSDNYIRKTLYKTSFEARGRLQHFSVYISMPIRILCFDF